jgi:hypothetical protein
MYSVHALYYIFICGFSGSTTLFHIISLNGMIFRKKKNYWTQNVYFDFLYNFVWNVSHSKKKWVGYCRKIYKCLHVKSSCYNETWIFLKDFWKILNYNISLISVQWEPNCSIRTAWRIRQKWPKVTVTSHSLANTPWNERTVTSPTLSCAVHLCQALCVSHCSQKAYTFLIHMNCTVLWYNLRTAHHITQRST